MPQAMAIDEQDARSTSNTLLIYIVLDYLSLTLTL